MLQKLLRCTAAMHPLCRVVLRGGVSVAVMLLAAACVLTYHSAAAQHLNTLRLRCAAVYPLLSLMTLAISIVGALLIDIYAKTQQRK